MAYNPYNPYDHREVRVEPLPICPPQPINGAAITFDLSRDRSRNCTPHSHGRAIPRGFFRRQHHHHRTPPFPFVGARGWDGSDSDDYSDSNDSSCTSDDDSEFYPYAYHPHHRQGRHRNRHRHIHLPAALPIPLPLVRRPVAAAAAAPHNYGYRRLHYQGGQERRGDRQTRTPHCAPHTANTQRHCGAAAAAPMQRNVLGRCRRWLFGDSGRCTCARGCSGAAAGGCCGEQERSWSPTRHREEEYWGPGTQDWAYGPPGNRNTNWRDTPWSRDGNGMATTHCLAPGAVVEEVEEGGTLPTTTTFAADRTHNHYHIGTEGHGRRRSSRKDDKGVLGLVDRERDRELQRHMLDREWTGQRDWADRREWNQREWSEREAAWKRDMEMLKLLDRTRERDRDGADVVTRLLDGELERSRIVNPGFDAAPRRKKMRTLAASEESDGGKNEGLKLEMKTLRKDFQKLLRSSSKTSSVAEASKDKKVTSAVSSAALRGRKRPSPAPHIQFDRGRTVEDESADGDSDEDEDGEEDDEDEDGTAV